MRKLILLLPVFIFAIASCNLPISNSSKTNNLIATKVAQTLQAAQTQMTPTIASNATVIVVTATPNPLLSPTPTQTITPTPTPADPKLTLGTPVYADSFTSGSAFGLKTPYTDDAVTMTVENSNLIMASSRVGGGIRWRLTYLTPRNYYVEGTFKTVTCSSDDFYGLTMRAPNYGDGYGYYFGISCAGEYYFMRWDASDQHTLVAWTADPAIISGSGKENRLGVLLKENHFSLYINGNLIKELDDDGINAKGYFGVFISAINNPGMTVQAEEIDQWDLP